jgi:phage antirepressor YoqD-like protein
MSNLTKLFDYQGAKITFRNDEGVAYVNATQMAKKFGTTKAPKHWLKTQQTIDFLVALSEVRNITSANLVKVKYGNNGGTWMHEDAAIEFSRWLSPSFAIWCNDRIKELLNTGTKSIQPLPNSKQLARMVIDAETKREEAERQLAITMPRYEYVEKVFNCNNTFNINEIAQDFGVSAEAMNKKLHDLGIQYKQGKQWMLYAQFRKFGFTKQITMMRNQKPITHTVWTERGRAFIHKQLNPEMMMAVAARDESLYRINQGYSVLNLA